MLCTRLDPASLGVEWRDHRPQQTMPLSPGTRLGHYDVTALLGEGSMGQVWQTTDTQLGRQGRRAQLGGGAEGASACAIDMPLEAGATLGPYQVTAKDR